MPHRDVVRSLSRPVNGFPSTATREPTAATSDNAWGASSGPTNELSFRASVTSRGEISTREVLMNARA
jgi:hypothetical protein